MDEFKRYYKYNGPVVAFGKVLTNNFKAETIAISPEKALSNLAFQFKQNNNLSRSARVNLLEKYLTVGDFTS